MQKGDAFLQTAKFITILSLPCFATSLTICLQMKCQMLQGHVYQLWTMDITLTSEIFTNDILVKKMSITVLFLCLILAGPRVIFFYPWRRPFGRPTTATYCGAFNIKKHHFSHCTIKKSSIRCIAPGVSLENDPSFQSRSYSEKLM